MSGFQFYVCEAIDVALYMLCVYFIIQAPNVYARAFAAGVTMLLLRNHIARRTVELTIEVGRVIQQLEKQQLEKARENGE